MFSDELSPNMSAIVGLVPTICFRVPAGDTVSSRGVGSGERAVLLRLVMIIAYACCVLELFRCERCKRPFSPGARLEAVRLSPGAGQAALLSTPPTHTPPRQMASPLPQ